MFVNFQRQVPDLKPTNSYLKIILPVPVGFSVIISFPFLALVSKSFISELFCPFSVNLKAKDIHFLDVSEKETVFLVSA